MSDEKNDVTDASIETPEPATTEQPALTDTSSDSAPATQGVSRLAIVALTFAILALLLSSALLGLGWWYSRPMTQQIAQLQQVPDQVQKQQQLLGDVTQQQQQISQQADQLQQQVKQQLQHVRDQRQGLREELSGINARQQQLTQQIQRLNRQQGADWVLSEALYLSRLAGQKVYLEHNPKVASELLQDAKRQLAALSDPSLTSVRRALEQDITALNQVPQIDLTQLVVSLDNLVDQTSSLTIGERSQAYQQQTAAAAEVSADTADWQANLATSWHHFMDSFFTVTPLDEHHEPPLSMQQEWFLRANLRLAIQQAQLAALQHNKALYQSRLKQAEQWLSRYFADAPLRQQLQQQLQTLRDKPLAPDLPPQLHTISALQQALDLREQGGQS